MLGSALDLVAEANGITIHSRSRWFRTPAFPPGSGPDFVNGAAMLETALDPETVLAALHGAEAALGRVRPGWMAIDLGQAQTVAPPRLILPHPRMHERGFVLAPLADIAPDWRHPVTGQTVAGMLAALPAAELAEIQPLE
jgi:2-amino-4-hydroxy-6-hydroxymethyldihydropteridine diphosphokinase